MKLHTEYVWLNEKKLTLSYDVNDAESLKLVFVCTSNTDTCFDVKVNLLGSGSTAELVGLVIPHASSNIMLKTHQIHAAAHTTSTLLVKSIVPKQASMQFEGMIRVEQDANGSDAYQKNENILLSDSSRVVTSPVLEILHNDVRCTHGATVKPISEHEIFYMQSRGIEKTKAEHMIVEGFIYDIVSQFPDGKIQKKLYNQIQHI